MQKFKQIVIIICLLVLTLMFSACRERIEDEEKDAKDDAQMYPVIPPKETFKVSPEEQQKMAESGLYFQEDSDSSAQEATSSESAPERIFLIGNDDAVKNGGSPPVFTLDKAYTVTELWTYHWNSGKGTPDGGSLSLTSESGEKYGPWQVEVRNSVYWVATINAGLPAGTYTVVDSDPDTLAQNEKTNGMGHAWMYGLPE